MVGQMCRTTAKPASEASMPSAAASVCSSAASSRRGPKPFFRRISPTLRTRPLPISISRMAHVCACPGAVLVAVDQRVEISHGGSSFCMVSAPKAHSQAPLPGELAGAAETERLSQICDKTQTANSVCGLERKKRAQRIETSLVAARSVVVVLTRLRRPNLFSRKRKDRGEKSAWGMRVHSASEFR